MTYKTSKFNLVGQAIAGRREWFYSDTGSTVANAVGAGFFADAGDKGAKTDDRLTFVDETTNITVTGLLTVTDTGATQGTFVQDTH